MLPEAELLPFMGRELSAARLFECDAAAKKVKNDAKEGGFDMKALEFIRKWWHDLWSLNVSLSTGIDSHIWDSKIEIWASASHKCC